MRTENPADDRGWGIRLRGILPRPLFRLLTIIYNSIFRWVPDAFKYGIGQYLRRHKMPYSLIKDGDYVIQVGAPKDILEAGRSRAVFFIRLVGPSGKVLVCEPDPHNCAALQKFVDQNGYADRLIIFNGALWSEPGELVLLSSRKHPAANLLVTAAGATDAEKVSEEEFHKRGYEKIPVRVETMDNVIRETGFRQPHLASITTNGAEREILEGMRETLDKGVPYIALALTRSSYFSEVTAMGYEYLGLDDRGQTFRANSPDASGT